MQSIIQELHGSACLSLFNDDCILRNETAQWECIPMSNNQFKVTLTVDDKVFQSVAKSKIAAKRSCAVEWMEWQQERGALTTFPYTSLVHQVCQAMKWPKPEFHYTCNYSNFQCKAQVNHIHYQHSGSFGSKKLAQWHTCKVVVDYWTSNKYTEEPPDCIIDEHYIHKTPSPQSHALPTQSHSSDIPPLFHPPSSSSYSSSYPQSLSISHPTSTLLRPYSFSAPLLISSYCSHLHSLSLRCGYSIPKYTLVTLPRNDLVHPHYYGYILQVGPFTFHSFRYYSTPHEAQEDVAGDACKFITDALEKNKLY